MAKTLKVFGILIGIILMLLLALAIAIPLLFNPNDYKPQISSVVEKATGRELVIEGDIELSLFPWLGMELGAITLSNAPEFGEKPFAHIDGAQVKIKLLPLLKQEVEMSAVTLQGLRLNLQIDQNGKSNWDDMVQAEPITTETTEPKPSVSSDAPPTLAALAIGGLHINDAEIVYDDKSSDSQYQVKELNLTTGPVSLDAPLDISFSSQFAANQPQISGQLNLKTRLHSDLIGGEKHRLENTVISLDFDSPELATKGSLELNTQIDIDLATEQYALKATTLQSNIQSADLPNGQAGLKLLADIQADLQQQIAKISNLQIESYGLTIKGDIDANNIIDAPEFETALTIDEFSPRDLLKQLAQEIPETADPQVLNQASLTLAVKGNLHQVAIDSIQLQLDDSTLSGNAEIEFETDKAMPPLSFLFDLDHIDADRYLPPVSDAETTAAATPATAGAAAAIELPMETLRDLDINGGFNIGQLKVSNLRIEAVELPVQAKDGLIRLHPLKAKLYQGSYQGDMQLDARGEQPKFSINEDLKSINVGPLLKDFMEDDVVSGTGSIQAKLTSQGTTPEEMTQALNGTASFSFQDGAVKGLNIAAMIRKARAKLKGESIPKDDAPKQTDFSELAGSFNIRDGVAYNKDMDAKIPLVRVQGEGSANLVTEKMDYLVNAKIVGTSKGQGGDDLDELKGLTVPVRITGPFTDPKIDLQYDELLKQKIKAEKARVKAKVSQQVEEKKAQLKPKLEEKKSELRQELDKKKDEAIEEKKEELKNKLKGLFQ